MDLEVTLLGSSASASLLHSLLMTVHRIIRTFMIACSLQNGSEGAKRAVALYSRIVKVAEFVHYTV